MSLSIDTLVRKVAAIAEVCAPEEKKKPQNEEKMDEFTARKKEISKKIKAVRFDLKEREALLDKNADAKRTAELSQQIRAQLKVIREEVDELSAIQKKEAKKARKKSPEIQQAIASRGEIVELSYQHLQECENWEKRRITDQMIVNRGSLMSGASSSAPATAAASSSSNPFDSTYDPTATNLMEIDDFSDQLQALRDKNVEIDQDLEFIASGVAKLKSIALDMGNEIEMQNVMIDEIQTKVEKTGEKLNSINRTLKKQLDGVMKGDKFLVNFVLLLILLAVIAFVVSQVVG